MRDAVRWLLVILLGLAVIGLIAYARGDEHRRGDDVGAFRSGVVLSDSAREAQTWLL